MAVMGVTGVGKSTFIQHFTDEEVVIGRSLEACKSQRPASVLTVVHIKEKNLLRSKPGTNKVDIFKCSSRSIPQFYLVDTPGFDDTYRSDTDILMDLAGWLNAAYSQKIFLTGIIYLHRILDVRLGGAAMRNLRMFKRLCGEQSLPRVVLATTFWSNVNAATGRQREDQLKTKPEFWGAMIASGSTVFRQDRGRESAKVIIDYLVSKRTPGNDPMRLALSQQMVDENKTLDQTGAGQELQSQLARQKEEYERKLEAMRKELRDAIATKDREWQEQLEEQKQEIQKKIAQDEVDRQRLQTDKEALQQRLDEQLNRDRHQFQRDYQQKELRMQGMEYELKMMKEWNKAFEDQQELKREVEREKHKLEMWKLRVLHAPRCTIM